MFHDTPNQYLQIIIYSDHQHIDKLELEKWDLFFIGTLHDMELYNSKKGESIIK